MVEELVDVKKLLISKHEGSKLIQDLVCIAFPEPVVLNIIGGGAGSFRSLYEEVLRKKE